MNERPITAPPPGSRMQPRQGTPQTASAEPCLANDARDLRANQPLDNAGEVFIEPTLQQRPQQIAHQILKSAIAAAEGQLALPSPLARQCAELRKSGGGCSGSR